MSESNHSPVAVPARPGWRTRASLFVRWHRRALAAVAAAVLVLATLTALSPSRAGGVPVVVTATDLPAGHKLAASDLVVTHYPADLVPSGAIGDPAALVGRTMVAAAGRGTPLGPGSVLGATTLPKGRMLVPVRVDDPAVLGLLRPGELISVLGADDSGTPVVLARRVRVAAVPGPADAGGLGGASSSGGIVVVDVDEKTAVTLGAWAGNPGLSVTLG
ncbi:SAF domain-containing protein [Propionibacteriaceae bacterium G1746]|uniref:SAF domain-containing protein n=1 Tax=Aestuariimicrobium sp. G57 TaxID=3418485 RepID=UPI003C15C399